MSGNKRLAKLVRLLQGALSAGIVSALCASCSMPTSFEGESKFPGGAEGCFHKCQEQRMEMASFVYVGEFATACACRLQTAAVPAPGMPAAGAPHAAETDDSGAVLAASTGVEMQRRRREAAQRQTTAMPMMVH
jgi:hypothetical protein